MECVNEKMQHKQLSSFAGIAYIVLLLFLVVMQGGFYADAACIAGIAAAFVAVISFFVNRRNGIASRAPIASYLFIGMGAAALVGSVSAGLSTSYILESSPWFFAGAMAVVSACIPKDARNSALELLGWLGVLSAAIGILMFAGIIPLEGSQNAGRLQFTFQYANAAGIWLAVMATLTMTSEDKHLRVANFFPMMALLLTQSVGAILIFAAACVVVLIMWGRKGRVGRIWALLMQLLCVIVAGGVQIALVSQDILTPMLALLGFAALLLLRKFLGPLLEELDVSAKSLLAITLIVCVFGVVVCFGALALTGRFQQAFQTFIERILQTEDALVLLQNGILFGIGPDAWSQLYHSVQTIQYTASVVHNGYAQIALDSGLIGLALFLGAIAKGLLALGKDRDYRAILLAAMMAVHFLIDFDLQFASLIALFVLFIVPSLETGDPFAPVTMRGVISLIVACILCVGGCMLGLWSQVQRDAVYVHAQDGDWPEVARQVEANDLFINDPDLRDLYLEALVNLQEYSQAADAYRSWNCTTANEAMLAAFALYQENRPLEAEEVLTDKLFQEPKNIDYFSDVVDVLKNNGASKAARERYAEAAYIANQPAQGLGSFMGNQKSVPDEL